MADNNILNDNEVRVIITADATPLEQELSRAKKDINNFSLSSQEIKFKTSNVNLFNIKNTVSSIKSSVYHGVTQGISDALVNTESIKKDANKLGQTVSSAVAGGIQGSISGSSLKKIFNNELYKEGVSMLIDTKKIDKELEAYKSGIESMKKDVKSWEEELAGIPKAIQNASLGMQGLLPGTEEYKTAKEAYDYYVSREKELQRQIKLTNEEIKYRTESYKQNFAYNESRKNTASEFMSDSQKDPGTSGKSTSILDNFFGKNRKRIKDINLVKTNGTVNSIVKSLGLAEVSLTAVLSTVLVIVAAIKIIKAIIKDIKETAKVTIAAIKKGAEIFAKITASIIKGFGSVGQTALSLFASGLTKIINLGKEMMSIFSISYKNGIDRLYAWSNLNKTQLAPSLDKIVSSCHALENSLASIAEPILNTLAPIIDLLTDKVLVLTNALAKLFAQLSGKDSYTKVIKATTQYSKATDGATKSLQRFLLGIDELQKLPDNNLSEIASSFESVKEELDNVSMFDIGAGFAKDLFDWLDSIDWTGIKNKAADLGKSLAELLNGFSLFEGLGSKIGSSLAEVMNTVATFFDDFFKEFDGAKFGQWLSDIVYGFFTDLDYNKIHSACSGFVKDLVDIINTYLEDDERVEAVRKGISTLVSNAVSDVSYLLVNINWGKLAKNISDIIKDTIKATNPKDISDAILSLVKGAVEIIAEFPIAEVVKFGMSIANNLIDGIIQAFDGEQITNGALEGNKKNSLVDKVITNFISGINAAIDSLDGSKIAKLVNTVARAVVRLFERVHDEVNWEKLGKEISKAMEEIDWVDVFEACWNVIARIWIYKNIFKGKVMYNLVKDLVEDFRSKVNDMISDFLGIGDGIGQSVIQGIKDALTLINPFSGLIEKANAVYRIIQNIKGELQNTNKEIEEMQTATEKYNESASRKILNTVTGGLFYNRYASGGVVYGPTAAIVGEYAGASTNPEIITPENKMREIFAEGNSELANVYIQVGRQIVQAIQDQDFNVSIGDDLIARAAARGNNNYRRMTGAALI